MKNGYNIFRLMALSFFIGAIGLTVIGISIAVLFPEIWLFTVSMCFIGFVFVCVGSICSCCYRGKRKRKQKLISQGKYVYAQIMDITIDPYHEVYVDRISMNPFFVICQYVDENCVVYNFKSEALLYNPSGLLQSNKLKVYVNMARPEIYYVDTNEILPEDAVLHKFKYDSKKNAESLVNSGKYINAITCGVELIGLIKVNSMIKSGFLKFPDGIAGQYNIKHGKNGCVFLGYTILCRYQASDGTMHIFSSKGIWGEPDSLHIGEKVKVFFDGKGYKKYHVDLKSLI